jgi:hypothetical protein
VGIPQSSRRRAPKGYRFVPDCGLDKEAFPSVIRKIIEAVRDDPVLARVALKAARPGFPPQIFGPFGFANRTKMLHVKHFGTIDETECSRASYIRRPSDE